MTRTAARDGLPGEPILWILIASELLVFGGGLLAFMGARALDPATFAAGRGGLDATAGALNTLALVTSGYCAARAAQALDGPRAAPAFPEGTARAAKADDEAGDARALAAAPAGGPRAATRARLWLGAAAALGALFLLVKAREYAAHAAAGVGVETDAFFTLYHLLTGFHAMHVAAGIVVLALVAARPSHPNVEAGGQFWHMVDLVWVLIFPVVYLLP